MAPTSKQQANQKRLYMNLCLTLSHLNDTRLNLLYLINSFSCKCKQFDIQFFDIYQTQSMQNQNLHHFCLPKDIVYLATVSPASQFTDKEIVKKSDFDSLISALKYRFALGFLGKPYEKVTVPCIPAREYNIQPLKCIQNCNLEEKVSCLIKVPYQTSLRGYASGKRSAIVFENGKILRFKGCGNLNQGFVIENNQQRGSHYCHTAKRQLYMTAHISKVLQQRLGINSANRPICAFQFDENVVELKVSNELPLLKKYCCIFQTVGDRRAGTHLISPLQILFLNLCQIQSIDWKSIFVKKNRHNEEDGLIEAMVDYQLQVLKGQKFLDKYDKRPDTSLQYVDLVQQKDIKIANLVNFKENLSIIAEKFIKNQKEKQRLIDNISAIENLATVISIVCAKIGYQMGRIKRVFCEQGINWGFFNDHGTSWHCNAHLNNLIVCQIDKEKPLILPLDFDLAFLKDEFISIQISSQNYGKHDADLFQELMMGQYNSMEYSLSGFEIMENFSYEITKRSSDGKSEAQQKERARMARTAFRDTLVNAFKAGMRNKQEIGIMIQEKWQQNIQEIKSIVDSCLLISADFQT